MVTKVAKPVTAVVVRRVASNLFDRLENVYVVSDATTLEPLEICETAQEVVTYLVGAMES